MQIRWHNRESGILFTLVPALISRRPDLISHLCADFPKAVVFCFSFLVSSHGLCLPTRKKFRTHP